MSPTAALGIVASSKRNITIIADGSPYANLTGTQGATSYWPLNETTGTTMNDAISARHGSYNASTVLNQRVMYVSGVASAYSSGVTNGIGSIATSWIDSTYSVSMWYRPTNVGSIKAALSMYSASNTGVRWIVWHNSGGLNFTSIDGSAAQVNNLAGPPIKIGFDHLITVTKSATEIKYYVNATLICTHAITNTTTVAYPLLVGTYDTGNHAAGYYAGLAQFNGIVLTQSQIQAQYDAGYITPSRTARAFWKFDETSGSTFADSSGNGRTLTVATSVLLNQAPLHATNSTACAKASGTNYGLASMTAGEWCESGEFTYTFWARTPAVLENIRAVASRWTSSAGWIIWWRSNTLGVLINSGGANREFLGPTVAINTVAKYAVRVDAKSLSFFVNGSQVGSTVTMADPMPQGVGLLQLGSYNGAANQSAAHYDSVRYYGVALTASEILAEYNADL